MGKGDWNDVYGELGDDGTRNAFDKTKRVIFDGTKWGGKSKAKAKKRQRKPHKATTADLLDPADPMRSARELIAKNFTTDGLRTLHRYRGAFWKWSGSYFRLADDETIRADVWAYLEKAKRRVKEGIGPFKPNQSLVSNVHDALCAACQLDAAIEPPAWLAPDQSMPPARELMGCGNGLLHLPTGTTLHSPTPNFFNLTATEVEHDPAAKTAPQWIGFLDQLFGDDVEAINLLQEWFGYMLSADTSQQKILLIVGPKRSGKGTIARTLTRLVGRNSMAGPTAAGLSQQFGLETLIGKSVAIMSDLRIGSHTNKSTLVERLLSISGEDNITVDRKFKQAWNGRLPVRFVILTNELPSLSDGSGALAGRFMVLRLTESFYGREDLALSNKLATELPAILNWSIEGYRGLKRRGHFIQPASSLAAVEDIEMLGAPVKAFVRDKCTIGPGLEVGVDELWLKYQDWSVSEGRKEIGTKIWFGRDLNSAVPGLTQRRKTDESGKLVPTHVGIELRREPSI